MCAAPAEAAAPPAAERARVEALPVRGLKAELAARGLSAVGLSERCELVEALLAAPPVDPAHAAAPAAATSPVAAAGEPPANIRAEEAAIRAWLEGPFASVRAAADRGDAAAQEAMGWRYYEGEGGVVQDLALAASWRRLAADQGLACAQSAAGTASFRGEGVPRDDADALRWFRLAAAQGHPGAQASLGAFYEHGHGGLGVADLDKAVHLYKLAAASGFRDAADHLRLLGFV